MQWLKYSILAFAIGSTSACSGELINYQGMEASEKVFNQNQKNNVVALMDLETMFPDPQHRAFAKAAADGNVERVRQMVAGGMDVNQPGHRNATALFWAMKSEKGFEELLKLGADPNVVFDDGGSVLHWAARMEDPRLLELALDYGGDANLPAGGSNESPIFKTVSLDIGSGIPSATKMLVSKNADLDFQTASGETVLLTAAGLDRFDICLYLLQQGADPNAIDNNGWDLHRLITWRKKLLSPDSEQSKWLGKVEHWLAANSN